MSSPSILDIVSLPSPVRILDLGAMLVADERPSYQRLLERNACEITGLEPNDGECERLRLAHGNRANHRFMPLAAGDGGTHEFRVCAMRSRSSIYEPNIPLCSRFNAFAEGMDVVERRKIKTTRLDDLPEIGDVDYVKMDIQGAELAAIVGGAETLRRGVVIEVEVEFLEQYSGQPLFSDVDMELRKLGYMFHTFRGYGTRTLKPIVIDGDARNGLGQWLWSDAVYVRHLDRLAELRPEKLLKLAVVLHEIYGSYDFAYHALALHDARAGGRLSKDYGAWLEEHGSLSQA